MKPSAESIASIFDPAKLSLARKSRGIRKTDLARLVHITPAAITQIENGVSKPSPRLLLQLSLALSFPVVFFASQADTDPPQLGRAFFRSLRSIRQLDRDQAEARAALVYQFSRSLERFVVLPQVNLPEAVIDDDASTDIIESCAKHLREFWGITTGPIPSVVRLLELNGVIVTRHSAGRREFDAFSRWFEGRPVVVLSTDKGDLARSRFDAAHELGHLAMHADAEPGTHGTEHQAHRFAAAFLTPKDEIADELPRRLDWSKLQILKHKWGVSISALLFRSRELGTISEQTYRRGMSRYNQWGWRYKEPSPLPGSELPSIFSRSVAVLTAHRNSVEQVIADSGLPADFISELLTFENADNRPTVSLD